MQSIGFDCRANLQNTDVRYAARIRPQRQTDSRTPYAAWFLLGVGKPP